MKKRKYDFKKGKIILNELKKENIILTWKNSLDQESAQQKRNARRRRYAWNDARNAGMKKSD